MTRLEHGDQNFALSRVQRPEDWKIYEFSGGAICDVEDPKLAPLRSWEELDAAILIFLNCPTDTLSHGALCEVDGAMPKTGLRDGERYGCGRNCDVLAGGEERPHNLAGLLCSAAGVGFLGAAWLR